MWFDYYHNICVCLPTTVFLGMETLAGDEVAEFPVIAYNILEELIGEASDKEQYIAIWNADNYNQRVGRLRNANGPFLFAFEPYTDEVPTHVIGESSTSSEALVDIDGQPLEDSDGEELIDL